MGPNQTYQLLHSKGNYKQDERQHTEQEKIFANDVTDKGLISKVYKQLIRFNSNNKHPNPKMSRRSK